MNIRKTKGAKITACSFIALTLLGNYWLIVAVLGAPVAPWLYDLFILGAAASFVGGLVMIVEMAIGLRKDLPEDAESTTKE